MKRRDFITLLGGAAAAWPLAARAQQSAQIRRVGMLIGYAENDPETQARLAAFRQAFEQLGWKEARHKRGRPRLAEGEEGRRILERFADLSKPFGTTVEIGADWGHVSAAQLAG